MEINVFSSEVKFSVKNELKLVLDEKIKSIKFKGVCPNDLIECLEKLDAKNCNDLDTNGWQLDYWLNFIYKKNKYCLSGGAYYGDATFSISDEKDDEDEEGDK